MDAEEERNGSIYCLLRKGTKRIEKIGTKGMKRQKIKWLFVYMFIFRYIVCQDISNAFVH